MISNCSEGEIVETGVSEAAESLSPPTTDRAVADHQDRPEARLLASPSPEADIWRERSPGAHSTNPLRGIKRSRDDQVPDYDDGRSGFYGDSPDRFRRTLTSYRDLDRPAPPILNGQRYRDQNSNQRRDRGFQRNRKYEPARDPPREQDRYHDRGRDQDNRHNRVRQRNGFQGRRYLDRSRSPYHHGRTEGPGRDSHQRPGGPANGRDDSPRRRTLDGHIERGPRDDRTLPRQAFFANFSPSNSTLQISEQAQDFSANPGASSDASMAGRIRSQVAEVEPEIEETEPIDEDAEIARRRLRRQEIMAKSTSTTPLLIQTFHLVDKAVASPDSIDTPVFPGSDKGSPIAGATVLYNRTDGPGIGNHTGDGPKPDHSTEFNFDQVEDLGNKHWTVDEVEANGRSAADYDPTADKQQDELRDRIRQAAVVPRAENGHDTMTSSVPQEQEDPEEQKAGDEDREECVRQENRDDCDSDDFDMFAEDFDEKKYVARTAPKMTNAEAPTSTSRSAGDGGGMLDGDDKDGYYKIRIGEVLNGRYQIQTAIGRGMSSGVARALDVKSKKLIAVKIMRNNDALRKAGFTEINILQKLNDADPEARKHMVRFERHFDHKGHLCMVFENMGLNLREILRKFGNNVGINLNATRAYAQQIFVALAHLKKCSIIHADLKPDNILVTESRNVLKICDLGTAIDRSDAATANHEVTPYLVSRFYRAPEIMLGMPYDYGSDMWSIGCTLYELYTGKILFTGDNNNQMLRAIMEVKGRLTPKLYKHGLLSGLHFDDMGRFLSRERDKTLGKINVRTLSIVKPIRDLRTRLLATVRGMDEAEARDLNLFADLLDQCLALNPKKRIQPLDALRHEFFTSKSKR